MRKWYVLKDAPAGGDGKTFDNPFPTIWRAAQTASPGDIIYIGPGIYTGDPLILRRSGSISSGNGVHAFQIHWVGDPMGEHLRVPPGAVQVPYCEGGAGCTVDNNVIWFIDFYSARPSYTHPTTLAQHGGGYSAHFTDGLASDNGDPWFGKRGKFTPIYFISCKFSHGVRMIVDTEPPPSGAGDITMQNFKISMGLRSCLIGYNFVDPYRGLNTIFFINTIAISNNRRHNAGKLLIYGCTLKAAPTLGSLDSLVQCFNTSIGQVNDGDPLTIIPISEGYIVAVNSIFDVTTSANAPSVYGYIQPPNFDEWPELGNEFVLSGAHNIYRYKVGYEDISFSPYATLTQWQEASIREIGNLSIYVDKADDKVKFKMKPSKVYQASTGAAINLNEFPSTIAHPTALSVGVWYHVAAVFDKTAGGGLISIIVNGTTTSTGCLGTYKQSLIEQVTFGGPATLDRAVRGRMDEIRIWDRALSSAEVALYDDVDLDPALHADLARYYKCDDASGTVLVDVARDFHARVEGAAFDPDIPFGSTGYSLLFGADAYVSLGVWSVARCPIVSNGILGTDAGGEPGSFTIEFWVKLDTLPSSVGKNAMLFGRGTTMQDFGSFNAYTTDDLFQDDGWHLEDTAIAIDAGLPAHEDMSWGYSGDFDVEGDFRPYGEHVDIGADEAWPTMNPDFVEPYGFTSKMYGYTVDGFFPSRFLANFDCELDFTPEGTEVCPGQTAPVGGAQDHLRVLCSFNPARAGKWIEIYNSMTDVDLRGVEQRISNSYRGPHFRVCFEFYPHALHLLKFDLGQDDSDARTVTISEVELGTTVPPGCEVIAYNFMFKERVGSAVARGDGTFEIDVWPGTYYLRFQGPGTDVMDQPRWVTVGFSDWYAPFGQTTCPVPLQADWAGFENDFMGVLWSQWYMKEQFIDEAARISTELPDAWPYELYNKKALVRCGRLLKSASWMSNFQIYTDPPLNLEGWENLWIWNFTNLFIPWP